MSIPWLGEKIVEAFGYRMRFLWSEAEFKQALDQIVLHGWSSHAEGDFDVTYSIKRTEKYIAITKEGEDRPHNILSEEQLPDRLKSVVHLDLATYAPDLVFVHAGVVLAPQGLIVIPGRSHTGKSTFTRALTELGCPYYSDEYAVIRGDGRVVPFPRPLCQRLGGGKERHIPAPELGWNPKLGPEPVVAVVSTRYQKDGNWEPEIITPGQATLELFANTVSAQIAPALAMDRLPRVAERALCLKGERGEAPEAARDLLGLLSSESNSAG